MLRHCCSETCCSSRASERIWEVSSVLFTSLQVSGLYLMFFGETFLSDRVICLSCRQMTGVMHQAAFDEMLASPFVKDAQASYKQAASLPGTDVFSLRRDWAHAIATSVQPHDAGTNITERTATLIVIGHFLRGDVWALWA